VTKTTKPNYFIDLKSVDLEKLNYFQIRKLKFGKPEIIFKPCATECGKNLNLAFQVLCTKYTQNELFIYLKQLGQVYNRTGPKN